MICDLCGIDAVGSDGKCTYCHGKGHPKSADDAIAAEASKRGVSVDVVRAERGGKKAAPADDAEPLNAADTKELVAKATEAELDELEATENAREQGPRSSVLKAIEHRREDLAAG